ncbi:U11/U12 small nuclear ribonucleoprotein 48 kDa protein-like [Tachypleus tridentatus]|uniref:U11/U12 small nuclear ribonucleoprotein 48 kDa protein-like n=1 Tax=Tachypleus tridentatus TaxID=6853 RepID=UPI003FD27640
MAGFNERKKVERELQLKKLNKFTEDFRNELNSILSVLEWTSESFEVLQKEKMVTCPLDSGHRLPSSSLSRHTEFCKWFKAGYTREEMEKAVPSSHFFYKTSTSVVPVLIDKKTQKDILLKAEQKGLLQGPSKAVLEDKDVPLTMERCVTELSPEERLAIYEHVVEKGKATNKPMAFRLEDLQMSFEKKDKAPENPKSELELLAELRDYKRRRVSYRSKNVHITKKSYTEKLRDVIENQTEYLKALREQEKKERDQHVTDVSVISNSKDDQCKDTSNNIRSTNSLGRHHKRNRDCSSCKERDRYHGSSGSNDRKRRRNSSRDERNSEEWDVSTSHSRRRGSQEKLELFSGSRSQEEKHNHSCEQSDFHKSGTIKRRQKIK